MSLFRPSSETAKVFTAKVFLWGGWGAGKSHFGLSAPKPALLDVENRGASFAIRPEFKFVHAPILNLTALGEAFKEIRSGSISCESIVWDSSSATYEQLIEEHTKMASSSNARVTDWVTVNRRMLSGLNFVFGISGKNVIVTAHGADKLVRQGSDNFTKAGQHFLGDERFRYGFDYVFRLEAKGDPAAGATVFHVEKSASPHIRVGATIPGLTWPKFVSIVNPTTAPVEVAPEPITVEQLARVNGLDRHLKLGTMALGDYVKRASSGRTNMPGKLTAVEGDRLIVLLEEMAA